MEESAVEYSLNQNRLTCGYLNYSSISSHMMEKLILTEEQDSEIQIKSETTKGRMNGLVDLLLELNTEAAFHAFRAATINSGEMGLANKLLRDFHIISKHSRADNTAPECLFIPEILNKIFQHLGACDLRNVRLVCNTWNNVIIASVVQIQKFQMIFGPRTGHNQMLQFLSMAPTSEFCKKVSKFKFATECIHKSEWVFYKAFFMEFGLKITSLELRKSLDINSLRLIFSPEILLYLRNVQELKIEVFPQREWLPADESFTFRFNLHTLDLVEPESSNGFDDLMYFLGKLLQNDHKLKSCNFWMWGQEFTYLPPNIIKDLFKNNTIQGIDSKNYFSICFNDACLEHMTVAKGGKSTLQNLNLTLLNVNLDILKKFLSSHNKTLTQLLFYVPPFYNSLEKIRGFPTLDSLDYLLIMMNTTPTSRGGWRSFSDFSFVSQMPNLKTLIIACMGHSMSPMEKGSPLFQHKNLRRLRFQFLDTAVGDGNWILSFLPYVPNYFSGLSTFEILESKTVNETWRSGLPVKLGHLVLQKQEMPLWEDQITWSARKSKKP